MQDHQEGQCINMNQILVFQIKVMHHQEDTFQDACSNLEGHGM